MQITIDSHTLYKFCLQLINFRDPTVCRHYVILSLLSMLEENKIPISIELVKAVSENSAGDEEAKEILSKLV